MSGLRPRQVDAIAAVTRACCIEGCSKPVDSKGMCGMHAQRVRRYGDPHYVTSNQQFRENCRAAALEYKVARPNVYKKLHDRHEHRVIAEQKIGRPLVRGEIVHHIDGDKHNNHPDNLQVMTQSDHLKMHRTEMESAKWKLKRGE